MPILRFDFELPCSLKTHAVSWWQNSPEAHGLVALGPDQWESVPGTGVMRHAQRHVKGPSVSFEVFEDVAANVRREMDRRVGWGYGNDKILRFVFPFYPVNRHTVICSQLQYIAARAAGLVYEDDPVQTPREMHVMLREARHMLDLKHALTDAMPSGRFLAS